MAQTREVIAYDHPSNVGGTFTVSVVKVIDETFAEVRVWYGRPSPTGWIPWREWDGYIFKAKRSDLTNERKMPLFRDW